MSFPPRTSRLLSQLFAIPLLFLGACGLPPIGLPNATALQCELAVAHLQQCCPAWNGTGVACAPSFTEDQSSRIQNISCSYASATLLCDRLVATESYGSRRSYMPTPLPDGGVPACQLILLAIDVQSSCDESGLGISNGQ